METPQRGHILPAAMPRAGSPAPARRDFPCAVPRSLREAGAACVGGRQQRSIFQSCKARGKRFQAGMISAGWVNHCSRPPAPGGQLGGNCLRATQGQRCLRPRPGWQCQGPHDLPTVGPVPAAQPVAMRDMRGSGWSPVPQCHPLGRVLLPLRLPKLVGAAMGLPPSSLGRDEGQSGGDSPCSPQPWVAWQAARPWQEPEPRGFGQGPGSAADESVRPEHPGAAVGFGVCFPAETQELEPFPCIWELGGTVETPCGQGRGGDASAGRFGPAEPGPARKSFPVRRRRRQRRQKG